MHLKDQILKNIRNDSYFNYGKQSLNQFISGLKENTYRKG